MYRSKQILKTFISCLIVFFATIMFSYFIDSSITIWSSIGGLIGFFLFLPAIDAWERILWGPKDDK